MRPSRPALLSAFSIANAVSQPLAGSETAASAQTVSIALHVLAILTLLWAASIPVQRKTAATTVPMSSLTISADDLASALRGMHTHDTSGHGSNHQPEVATAAPLPPRSSIQIVRPTLPTAAPHELPVPPTILDPQAPPILRSISEIGIPSSHAATNSAGKDGGSGVGDRKGDTIGNGGDGPGGEGFAEDGSGIRAAAMPGCLYCPDPAYSDAAREAKLQGMVTLRVLVTSDGRASSIQLVKGIGLGLDERAIAAVRTWRFKPARSASGKPVSDWILVETVFRLF